MRNPSRRKILKDATLVGVGVAAANACSFSEKRPSSSVKIPPPNGSEAETSFHFSGRSVASSNEEYDFIIVGAGAGGAPLAAKLAKNKFRVLLLDAGGDFVDENGIANLNVRVPAFHAKSTEDKKISWEFFVKHYEDPKRLEMDSKYVKKCTDKKGIFYPRAAVIGGCTSHNAMVTMYPDNADWEFIQALAANDFTSSDSKKWSPDEMRKIFTRIENHLYDFPNGDHRFGSSNSGWLSTERPPASLLANDYLNSIWTRDSSFAKVFMAAIRAAGNFEDLKNLTLSSATFGDPNDYTYIKSKRDMIAMVPRATRWGKRSGPRDLLMSVARNPEYAKYLTVEPYSHATQVVFKKNGDRSVACGVRYLEQVRRFKSVKIVRYPQSLGIFS